MLDNLMDTIKAADVQTINLIIKGDVQGSVETLAKTVRICDNRGNWRTECVPMTATTEADACSSSCAKHSRRGS